MLLLVAPCVVEMQSVGYWESECSYVKLNSYYAMELTSPDDENDQLNPSGIYTVLLDKVAHRIDNIQAQQLVVVA